jgi:hypothetical protein
LIIRIRLSESTEILSLLIQLFYLISRVFFSYLENNIVSVVSDIIKNLENNIEKQRCNFLNLLNMLPNGIVIMNKKETMFAN